MRLYDRCSVNTALCFFILIFNLSINTYALNNGGTSLLDLIGMSPEQTRPAIYTFVHTGHTGEESNTSLDQEHILVWAEAWANAGWDPRAFTKADVIKHPNYVSFVDKLSRSGVPEKGWDRFLRYLAMSMLEDGGYYSNSHVFPLNHAIHFFDGKGFRLPNEGKFTMHDGHPLSLLSGNKDEWNRILLAIIRNDDGNDHIQRDVLLLSSLNQENPKETIIDDVFVDVNYIFGLKERNTQEEGSLCKIVFNKKATRLVTDVQSLGFETYRDYWKGFKSSLNKCKPTMHVFFELAHGKNTEKSLLMELEEWRKSWEGAGWNTVVLTLDDAKRHPLYESFRNAFEKARYQMENFDKMCYYRWLAMASTSNGGWMADFDTYPLNLFQNFESGFDLPNNGVFTSNLHFVPNLVSASKSEWNRMAELLLANYKEHAFEFWSEMLALQDILRTKHKTYKYTYDAIELSTVYSVPPPGFRLHRTDYGDHYVDKVAARTHPFELKTFCHMTEGKLAVHFSHASCRRVGFCHNNRGPILNKWLEVWKQQCLFDM